MSYSHETNEKRPTTTVRVPSGRVFTVALVKHMSVETIFESYMQQSSRSKCESIHAASNESSKTSTIKVKSLIYVSTVAIDVTEVIT